MARPATEVEIPAAAEGEVVRDMYGENDPRTKAHRDMQLNNNPNVLFRIYREGLLHILLFRPTANIFWRRLLQEEYQDITFQHTVEEPIGHTMNLSGNREELERFCDNFRNNLQRANNAENEMVGNNLEDANLENANNNNHDNEIEELQQRIRELELENTQLRQQRDENLQRPPDDSE
nr:uncharacterized protein LOC100001846 isoform X1 [Danio rerio]|eukprot:XP_001338885.3 uncharacterized protein LOC100001846 isoform X1 [Danio rerio]